MSGSNSIEKRLHRLLKELHSPLLSVLGDEVTTSLEELVCAREWGIALENLCVSLYEYDIPISMQQFIEIKGLGREMNMRDDSWDFVKELINYTVAEPPTESEKF